MVVSQVRFSLPGADAAAVRDASERIGDWIDAARQNGQILGGDASIYYDGDMLGTIAILPEPDALSEQNANSMVSETMERLRQLGVRGPDTATIGADVTSAGPCNCDRRQSLILYTNYLFLESPLRCGDCFRQVPLYGVPPIRDDSYYDIKAWEADYQSCDRLQMNCATGERFGIRELSLLDSSLTQRGRAICSLLETRVGLPVYYYLYRYSARSLQEEEERLCPECGGEWLLKPSLFDRFDFRCEHCRLLSNIAYTHRR